MIELLAVLQQHYEAYYQLGWSLIPLQQRDKKPDWHLLGGTWEQYQQHRAPLDQLEHWFSRPRNIGIVTGAISGVVVVDCDNITARDWIRERGLTAKTMPLSRTGKGWHLFFKHPGKHVGNRAHMHDIPGLDLRGDGGYVVAPPSQHSSGRFYRWLIPADTPLPDLPKWFLAAPEAAPTTINGSHTGFHLLPENPLSFAEKTLLDRLTRLLVAPIGSRNDELNRAAFTLGQLVGLGELDRVTVESQLLEAGLQIGLSEREIQATIKSGVGDGIAKCNRLLEYRQQKQRQWWDRRKEAGY